MKKLLLIGAFALLAMLVFVACSDDEECPTCPANTQQGVAFAQIALDEGDLELWGAIFGIEGLAPDIDSVVIDGDTVAQGSYMDEGGHYVYMEYEDSTTRSSGDQVDLEIFAPGGRSACTVTLLDWENDRPQIPDWNVDSPYDTIPITTAIDIVWNQIDNAQWYLVNWRYRYDSSGTSKDIDGWLCQTDTTYSVPSTATAFNGRYSFDIVAGTGPRPDGSTGNLTGGVIKGTVNSYAGEYFSIYIGTGNYNGGLPVSVPDKDEPESNLRELMMNLQRQ